jgi:hypothetical protein
MSGTAGDEGGGIRNYGTCTLANTIVAGNTVDLGTTIDLDGSFTSLDYNLLGSTTHATISLAAHDKAGSDSSPLNAKFAGYGSNGGALDTDALAADSPARDAGNPNNSPSTDERGFARFGPPDIGGFEFHPAPIVTTGAATNITVNSATLNAIVNPNGLSTTIQFTTDFGFSVTQDVGSGTNNLGVSANVSGLSPNTAYHFNVTATSSAGTTQGTQQTFTTSSPTPTPTPTTSPPTTLANVSTRLPVLTDDNALIGGFIVTGTQPKKVIIRALGPSVPVPGALADPTLELYSGSTLLESNDNWVDSPNKQAIIDSTIPPSNNLEAAIVRTLPANGTGYTAIVRGANNGTGIGVVEAYDLDRSVDSKLANISTRGLVQMGDNVLIAGTIILGSQSQKVIIRAIGPSLPIAGKLEDPTLELRDSQGTLLEANDNWVDSPNKQAIIDSTIPPTNDKESAIVRTLPANGASYTAIVRGVNNTTGVAVVEVYALN